jgi:hypothetical protein
MFYSRQRSRLTPKVTDLHLVVELFTTIRMNIRACISITSCHHLLHVDWLLITPTPLRMLRRIITIPTAFTVALSQDWVFVDLPE